MPKDRRSGGRVTTPKKHRIDVGDGAAVRGSRQPNRSAEPSTRYTPPKADYRVRPGWHRIAGWLGVAVGVLVIVLNDGMYLTEDVNLLPFGHSELYFLLGIAIAGSSTWFLGLFDRGTTIYG